MNKNDLKDLRDTYQNAASSAELPAGWFVRVETAKWVSEKIDGFGVFGMDEDLESTAMPMVVNEDGIAHVVAEHNDPVEKSRARRHLKEGIQEHES